MQTFDVMGVQVAALSHLEASRKICGDIGRTSFSVFTLNLDHLVKLRGDEKFREAYGAAKLVLADGFPIVLSGRIQGYPCSRTTGADLIEPLCCEAGKSGMPVMFVGSSAESLFKAGEALRRRCPGLRIVEAFAPGMGFDVDTPEYAHAIRLVHQSGAKLCFVALGAPKQEIFAARAAREVEGVSFVCIGAGLDFISGHQTRAPRAFQIAGAEWLWRLASAPLRLGPRYLRCMLMFPLVLGNALRRRRSRALALP